MNEYPDYPEVDLSIPELIIVIILSLIVACGIPLTVIYFAFAPR